MKAQLAGGKDQDIRPNFLPKPFFVRSPLARFDHLMSSLSLRPATILSTRRRLREPTGGVMQFV